MTPTPYSGVLLSSILLHGVLILLCLGLKASGEIPHLCKLLSRLLCSATENEWVPVPGVMGDGQAIAQGVPGEVIAHQGKKKKYIYLSHQPGEGSHGISVLIDLLSIGKRL